MSKSTKQVLVAELTTALTAMLPPITTPLPTGIAQAVDALADSILRWQLRQTRPKGPATGRRVEVSASDELTRLMDTRLHEEVDPSPADLQADEAVAPTHMASHTTTVKKQRPRLGSGKE